MCLIESRVLLLLAVSQSVLAASPYLGLMAIFLLYNRKFWFRMSWDVLPDGWMGLSCKGSHSMSVPCVYLFLLPVLYFLDILYITFYLFTFLYLQNFYIQVSLAPCGAYCIVHILAAVQDTWTILRLIATKFEPFIFYIFYVWHLFSCISDIQIIMILYDMLNGHQASAFYTFCVEPRPGHCCEMLLLKGHYINYRKGYSTAWANRKRGRMVPYLGPLRGVKGKVEECDCYWGIRVGNVRVERVLRWAILKRKI